MPLIASATASSENPVAEMLLLNGFISATPGYIYDANDQDFAEFFLMNFTL
jgi:hypothetical protein